MDEHDAFIIRVGTFFLVMGGGVFILFVVSDLANNADFDYFFLAAALIGIGWVLRRGKSPPPSSGRFATWNKKREEAKRKKQEKKEAKK
jgi:hypothetical protein